MNNYYIMLFDKERKMLSERVPLKDIIYNQDEVEFIFSSDEIEYETLPYNDFLFYSQYYEVVLGFDERE